MSIFRRLKRKHQAFLSSVSANLRHDRFSFVAADVAAEKKPARERARVRFSPVLADDKEEIPAGQQVPEAMRNSFFCRRETALPLKNRESEVAIAKNQDDAVNWCGLAKTSAFLLTLASAFYAGKVVALGLTLIMALVWNCLSEHKKRFSRSSFENIEPAMHSQQEVVSQSDPPCLAAEKNVDLDAVSVMPARKQLRRLKCIQPDPPCLAAEKSVDLDAVSVMPVRKQLRRLKCIQLPLSSCPGDDPLDAPSLKSAETIMDSSSPILEAMAESSCSTPTQDYAPGGDRSSNKHKLRLKWFKRLVRKKERVSCPVTPVAANPAAARAFQFSNAAMSDGSDSERLINQRMAPLQAAIVPIPDSNMDKSTDVQDERCTLRVAQNDRMRKTTNAWGLVGLMIAMAGLLSGRVVAVSSLVCWWYLLYRGKKRSGRTVVITA